MSFYIILHYVIDLRYHLDPFQDALSVLLSRREQDPLSQELSQIINEDNQTPISPEPNISGILKIFRAVATEAPEVSLKPQGFSARI